MKKLLILAIAINLIFLPVSSVLCQEQKPAMGVEITSYTIGGVNIEASPTMVDDTTVVIEPIRPEGVSAVSGVAEPMPAQFPDQPIPKISCGLSAIPDNNKIVITVNVENIGTAKAKSVKAAMDVPSEVKIVEKSGIKLEKVASASASDGAVESKAIGTGEIESGASQEFTYEMFLAEAPEGDLIIPLAISGSGSEGWIVELALVIAKWWLEANYPELYGIIDVVEGGVGFDAIYVVLAGLAAVYLVKRRR